MSLNSAPSPVQQKFYPSADWWFTLYFPWLICEVFLTSAQSLSLLANASLLFTTIFFIHGDFNRHEWVNEDSYERNPQCKGEPWNSVINWASRLHIFFKLTSPCSFGQCQWSLSRLTIIKPLVYSSMAFLWACECACSSIGLFTWTDVTQCEYWLQN